MNIKILTYLLILLVFGFYSNSWGQKPIYQAFPERHHLKGLKENPTQKLPQSFTLPGAFIEGRNVYSLDKVSVEKIRKADEEAEKKYLGIRPRPPRVGIVRAIDSPSLSFRFAGKRLSTPDGTGLTTMAIRAPGAFGIRLHIVNFNTASGSLLLYGYENGNLIVHGPYTGKGPQGTGEFWTSTIPGDTVYLELNESESTQGEIVELLHLDRSLSGPPSIGELPCHTDAMCNIEINSHSRDATGQMNFIKDGHAYLCTGTLLNDLDTETSAPYFLTARHCLNTQQVANTLEVVWFYQTNACNGTLPIYSSLPRSNGSTLLETNGENDMTFLRLDGELPDGVGFAGWTTASIDHGYGIHHPDGSWKRVTTFEGASFCLFCISCGDLYDYDFYDFIDGIIEGGSSGSCIFNYSGQCGGQLKGTCTMSSGEITCGSRDDYTAQYGEFETTYPMIQKWLEIGGTINVNGSYTGTELGTPDRPFNTVNEANQFAWEGVRIRINPGSYSETVTISKKVTLLSAGGVVTIGE